MISIDGSVLVVFLILCIFMITLRKGFFLPLLKVMEERDSLVLQNQRGKERAQEQVSKRLALIEERLSSASAEGVDRRRKAREAALEKHRSETGAAKVVAETRVTELKAQLESEYPEIEKKMEEESTRLTDDIVRKVLHL